MYLNAKTNVEALHEIADLVQCEIEKLNKKADEHIPVVLPIGKYPPLSSFKWDNGWRYTCNLASNELDWFKSIGYRGAVTEASQEWLDKRRETILLVVKRLSDAQNVVEDSYREAIENNKIIREKIALMMEHAGISASYSEYDFPSSRSRKRDWVRKTAGWVNDLNRCVPIVIEGTKQDIDKMNEKVERLYNKACAELRQREKQRALKEEEVKSAHVLALLRAKYCPDNPFAEASDVLDSLLEKNKYLMLAYHLECTRNDWSEGFDTAKYGLSKFSIDTPEDQKIYDDIQGCFDCEDGRVFRDTEYGYGYLYSKVEDNELMSDFKTLCKML